MARRTHKLWKMLPFARVLGVLSAPMGHLLTIPMPPTRTGTVALKKASVLLTSSSTLGLPAVTQSIALTDLIGGNVALTSGSSAAGGVASFRMQTQMAADAIVGCSAGITGLNISFGGTL